MNAPPQPPDNTAGLRQQVLDWFVRRQREAWSAQDEQAFVQWLQADARHRSAYRQWEQYSAALDAMPADTLAQLRRNLARDKAQLAATQPPTLPAAAAVTALRRRWVLPSLGMAAAIVMTTGTGLLAWQHWQAQPVFKQAYASQRGQQLEVQLPDGSQLRLDTATRLEVSYYRERREVLLHDGQAVFSVQADTQRPFHVLAGPVGITVVGTRFSVRYTPGLAGSDGVRVGVEEGQVRVLRRDGAPGPAWAQIAEAQTLAAGQQISADSQGSLSPIQQVAAEGIAAWREHRISFVNTPLSQALAEFERYGSTGLSIHDPAVAALRLSGTFDPSDTQTLRKVLPHALPVRLQQVAGGLEIRAAR
ncbi:transmembrane sensor [Comamonas sp. BIGb0152]|uniref:FecR family protein n=1 Tax=Comamonas sp. BIGb0152 TaxID=2940601 RepID=UPI00216944FF|nr:FecR domain-containing protein [Comamonas sp. BIGb0152]MCS4293661.1 transmembrane sensor [Comamonas sp. BIGb0152]